VRDTQCLITYITNNWRLHRTKPAATAKISIKVNNVTYKLHKEAIKAEITADLGVPNPTGATPGYLGACQKITKAVL